MRRETILVAVALTLAGCGVVSTLWHGFEYARAVETELESSVGMRPKVGFNWSNGRLVVVTVTFPRFDATRPLPELAAAVRRAVANHFQQTPNDIVLGFSLRGSLGTVAQSSE